MLLVQTGVCEDKSKKEFYLRKSGGLYVKMWMLYRLSCDHLFRNTDTDTDKT